MRRASVASSTFSTADLGGHVILGLMETARDRTSCDLVGVCVCVCVWVRACVRACVCVCV